MRLLPLVYSGDYANLIPKPCDATGNDTNWWCGTTNTPCKIGNGSYFGPWPEGKFKGVASARKENHEKSSTPVANGLGLGLPLGIGLLPLLGFYLWKVQRWRALSGTTQKR